VAGRKRARIVANAAQCVEADGWRGRCKECTSRCSPTFNLTHGQDRKFRVFYSQMTDRFYLAKMSLGQILERGGSSGV